MGDVYFEMSYGAHQPSIVYEPPTVTRDEERCNQPQVGHDF